VYAVPAGAVVVVFWHLSAGIATTAILGSVIMVTMHHRGHDGARQLVRSFVRLVVSLWAFERA